MQMTKNLVRNGWTGNSGLYVSVVPNKHSKDIIKVIADVLATECNIDELHCTIMHSPYVSPSEKSVHPKTKIFRAKMKDIKLLGKEEDVLAIILESEDLSSEHERLKALGAKHYREFYLPHITIQAGNPFDNYYLDHVADAINGREIVLNNYSWDDIREDWK